MDSTANMIRQRLSLRKPLGEALDLTSRLAESLSLEKAPQDDAALDAFLKKELASVKEIIPSVKAFDRDFPSLAFSIATGIGKTRLMAAIIAYLNLKKGIKHFFILAPNLTLYEKLIRDFGDTSYSKYVFKGISEYVARPPRIVTGDNYMERTGSLFSDVEINIFNISKFNTENKTTTKGGVKVQPRMRRLSEYLGQSYFDYLASLPDLVILMDEAHRYHGDASKKAINELRPVLGLEMTATPVDEKGKSFRNIVYEYNLAQALADKRYVKDPTVASRKNFDRKNFTADEIELIKLEDGVNVHERTKLAIELYAKQNNRPVVHPFILVVCRDITHARSVKELLESERFFGGRYKDKVLQIDSSTKKDDEIERQFVALEAPDNKIEIVVHVNMLKEGWDVNNLYTIIPLRAADATILIEQTIGRGLRLPYGGERTGNKDVDTLTVIAHDNFSAVIAKAQSGDSVLSKLSYVELDESGVPTTNGKVETPPPAPVDKYVKKVQEAQTEHDKKVAQQVCDSVRAIIEVIPQVADNVTHYSELQKPEIVKTIKEKATELIKERAKVAKPLFAEAEAEEQIKQLNTVIKEVIIDYAKNVIEIPRIVLEQPKARKVYEDFDLYTGEGYNVPDVEYEIVRQSLATSEVDIITGKTGSMMTKPIDLLVGRLIDYDDVDYDSTADLLYKLAGQAIETIIANSTDKSQSQIYAKVRTYKEQIAANIYAQMCANSHIEREQTPPSRVLPFSRMVDQHIVVNNDFGYRLVGEVSEQKSWANKYVVKGFRKTYYPQYRFDSSTEWDFAYALENDPKILRWIRPEPAQFNIYWADGAKRYEPDFIVETDDAIYMCETKAQKDVDDKDVKAKASEARRYCAIATAYNERHGGKPWHYIIIPHNLVERNYSFDYIISQSKLSQPI